MWKSLLQINQNTSVSYLYFVKLVVICNAGDFFAGAVIFFWENRWPAKEDRHHYYPCRNKGCSVSTLENRDIVTNPVLREPSVELRPPEAPLNLCSGRTLALLFIAVFTCLECIKRAFSEQVGVVFRVGVEYWRWSIFSFRNWPFSMKNELLLHSSFLFPEQPFEHHQLHFSVR